MALHYTFHTLVFQTGSVGAPGRSSSSDPQKQLKVDDKFEIYEIIMELTFNYST